jgi:choline dehydrogenase
MQKLSQTQFDFIIIGAGSAGATLAARLTENNQFSVCLIEAGGKDTSPFIHIPFGLAFLSRMTNLGWEYDTEPQSQLNDRSLFWPRGKVLGGSSSLNAMCYIRGVPEDYDRWNDMGAKGWDWQTVLPYFKKSEKQQHGESEMHGADGYLSVSDLRHTNPLSSTFVDAAEQIGLSKVTDFNGPDREGLGFYQVTQENGQRCSTAKGYLTPALTRSNLTLLTKALVEKIQIIDGVATGVKLQQDHLDIIVQHHCKNRDSYSISLALIPRYIKNTFNYLFNRQGIFTSNVAEAGGFDKTQYAADIPDIQYHFLPAILLDHGRTTAFGYGFGVHVCGLYPKSRGEIRLRSNKPNTPAVIDPHYLEHLDDQKVMIDGVRRARKILAAASFDKYESWEVGPGPDAQTDEEILAFIRKNSETIYHPIGTCKMGDISDVMTVVDSQLKVKDIKGLRVVDASVMPSLVGGNTNAPTIMIAERCADLIKQEHK